MISTRKGPGSLLGLPCGWMVGFPRMVRSRSFHFGGWAFVLLAGLLLLGGCEEDCIECVDVTPPAVPTGVFSVTGDQLVTVYWNDLYYDRVDDLVEYAVYRSDEGPDGTFEYLGTVAWDQNFDETSGLHWYEDRQVVNGVTYDYAVLAIDAAGNESELSFEEVFDTPRPEGFALELFDVVTNPDRSGFDFSALELGVVNPLPVQTTADILVVFEQVSPGRIIPFVQVARPDVVRIQDYGHVALPWVDWAPEFGYSALGKLELIQGHSYVVEIAEGPNDLNYAKFAVDSIRSQSVVIDWAYQQQNGSPELKAVGPDIPTTGPVQVFRF